MDNEEWTNYWLDNRLWDCPPDTQADKRREAAWPAEKVRPQPAQAQHPTVVGIHTSLSSQAMRTVDGQIGLWIKIDPEVYNKWSQRAVTVECRDDNYQYPDIEAWMEFEEAHDWALHEAAQDWVNWFAIVERLAGELGWD